MEDEEQGPQAKDSFQKRFTLHLQRLFAEIPTLKDLNISNKVAEALTPDMVKLSTCTAGNVFYQEGDTPSACYVLLSGKVQHWKKDSTQNVPFSGNSEAGLPASKHCTALTGMLSKRAPPQPAPSIRRSQPAPSVRRSNARWPTGVMSRRPSTIMGAARRSNGASEFIATSVKESDDVPIQNFGAIVASNGMGSMFGDIELLVDQPRLTTAVSCSDTCEFLVIDKPEFDTAMKGEIHHAEIRQVAPHIDTVMTQFPFFRRLDPGVQPLLAEIMHFSYHRRKDTLFRQGDPGDLCYIILSGEVCIWVNGLKDDCSDNIVRKEYGTQIARSSCSSILTGLGKMHSLNKSAVNALDEIDDLATAEPPAKAGQVVILGPGKMFGELALLEDQPRSATVMCNEDSAFLTIEKADFERVLKKAMNKAVMSLPLLSEPLLHELPFFRALRPAVQQRVRHMVKYCVAQRGSVMFWEGEVPNRCYIVLSGELSCWRKAQGTEAARLGYSFSDDNLVVATSVGEVSAGACAKCAELASRLEEIGLEEIECEEWQHGAAAEYFTPSTGGGDSQAEGDKAAEEVLDQGLRKKTARKSMLDVFGVPENIFTRGSVFGDHELLVDQRCRSTVVCDKDCQFLYIDRADFDRVVKEDLMRMKVQELHMQVRRLLHGFPLFNNLPSQVQETVPEIVHYVSHARGNLLFREGDEPDMCYILLSGEVTIFKKRATALEQNAAASNGSFSQFPPVTQAHPETYERCVQLASKLAPVSVCLRRRTACEGAIMDLTKNGEVPVASLGPGSIVGQLGLLNNNPRNATVYCRKECEFLAIENCDFDRVLKREMARAKDEKLEFLRTYVPGMRTLPERLAEGLLYHFDKITVPLNHVFIEQGEVADGSIYFVWQGSVEFFTHSGKQPEGFSLLPDSAFRRLRVLIKGGVFGAVPVDMRVPFTAVARSAPCEVLQLSMQHMKQFPEPVMRGLRKLMDQTLVWASENCAPILTLSRESERRSSIRDTAPAGSMTATATRLGSTNRGNSHSLPYLSRVSRLQSSKIPRPLSLKIQRPLDAKQGLSSLSRTHSGPSTPGSSPSRGSDKLAMNKTWGGGLFQRTSSDGNSSELYDSCLGEALALKAQMPKNRKISLHMGLHMGKSLSLPQMRRAPDNGQVRSPERGQEPRSWAAS